MIKKIKQSYHFVAFLDVLGYKSYFENDRENETESFLQFVETAINDTINQINNYGNHIYFLNGADIPTIKIFSDNILISMKCKQANVDNVIPFLTLVRIIGSIQLKFINRFNLFLRGGLAKGLFYSNENFVFGKGLIKSYELEGKANYPKIMIEKDEVIKIIEEINKSKPLFGSVVDKSQATKMFESNICQDGDGNYFVNYLNTYQDFEKDGMIFTPTNYFNLIPKTQLSNIKDEQQQKCNLENHRKRLKNMIDIYGTYSDLVKNDKYIINDIEQRRKVQMKYMWTIDFHNKSCELAGMNEYKVNCKISMDNTVHLPKVEVIE